ncbi:MAG TPA: long-chain fatty acid--CoA ligase [Acidimicrobiia bacterium]|nr:long-chain fatty acid--CoA ligase [Acidimicrobiia bacterium]
MRSTMQSTPLTTGLIFAHGRTVYRDSQVATFDGEGYRRATFADVADRAERLAGALRALGVGPGDRVATLCWNHQEHLEAYFAVPGMGAVLHTLNLRLLPEQLAWIINHAEDRVLLVDGSLAGLLSPVFHELGSVEHVIVVGDAPGLGLGATIPYEEFVTSAPAGFEWPDLDEEDAASMCYTSGTTGDPKGVVYSHRSTFVHSLAQCSGNTFALNERDRIVLVVPMFHANAWGLPYSGWMAGCDFVLPGPHLQAPHLARLISEQRVTVAEGVPTIWNDMLAHADRADVDLSSLRMIVCGGSAVPRSLIERYRDRFGIPLLQGWGMTETSPLAALSFPPADATAEEELDFRAKAGRVIAGVQARIVDEEGRVLPWDGTAVGEIEVRGPWVTGSYFRSMSPDRFHDGWLRTGDAGTIDRRGFIQLTDRLKDVIKSGGEWISSVDLENRLMAHPDVLEAAVIGVPDTRWDERPLACVVPRPGATLDAGSLRSFLAGQVARWWLPERWTFLEEVPKTSVGKFDKRTLRALYGEGSMSVEEVEDARAEDGDAHLP